MHSILIPYKNDKSKREDVLLGYGDLAGCKASNGYFNSIIGRVCNRIGGANFKLNNFVYNLFKNIPPHHLHGGKQGFNKKTGVYFMPENKSVDVDNKLDFQIVEFLMKKKVWKKRFY